MIEKLEFEELQDEVMEHWESQGIDYLDCEKTGNSMFDFECVVKPDFLNVLRLPYRCVNELGFNSVTEYLKSKKAEEVKTEKMQGIEMGYSRITETSTKFFFEFAGRDLEFYIERDPKSGTAKLWLNPGNTQALDSFIASLQLEAKRSEIK